MEAERRALGKPKRGGEMNREDRVVRSATENASQARIVGIGSRADDSVIQSCRMPVRGMLAALVLAATVGCGSSGPRFKDGWTRGPSLPEPIQELQAGVLRGRIFVAGGIRAGRTVSAAVYRLDPASGRWDRVADLPEGRHHMPLAVLDDSLYAIGGLGPRGFDPVSTVWVYDETADRWLPRAPLPEPRGASAAVATGGRIIVIGGMGPGGLPDSIAIYDPGTDRWRHGAPVPTPGDHLAAAVVGGKVFAIGGRPLDPGRNFDRLEMYDPATDTWAALPRMPTARGGLAAAVLGDRIYTFGGETRWRAFGEHEVYDVRAGAWSRAPALPTRRHGLAAAATGGRIYVIGGGPRAGFAQTDAVEIFTPPAETALTVVPAPGPALWPAHSVPAPAVPWSPPSAAAAGWTLRSPAPARTAGPAPDAPLPAAATGQRAIRRPAALRILADDGLLPPRARPGTTAPARGVGTGARPDSAAPQPVARRAAEREPPALSRWSATWVRTPSSLAAA